MGFLENHKREDQDFLVKMVGGVAHIVGCLYIEKEVSTGFH